MKEITMRSLRSLLKKTKSLQDAQKAMDTKIEIADRRTEDLAKQLDGLCLRMAKYYDRRSESWRGSPEGEAYQEWIEIWEDVSESLPDTPEGWKAFNYPTLTPLQAEKLDI